MKHLCTQCKNEIIPPHKERGRHPSWFHLCDDCKTEINNLIDYKRYKVLSPKKA